MDAILSFEHVNFAYGAEPGAPTVLRELSLTVAQGEFLALVGHNGSGKSTLAKLCNAILQPTSGTVLVSGMDTSDPALTLQIRQTVGMVFQNPDNQLVATVVEEDVAFALENLGVPPPEIRSRVDEALRAVGMYEYREHAPHRLSGGQKQRVAIAGAIAMRPRCIVLDEPTAMLDPQGRDEVMELIETLNREHGVTVILVTHHMSEASRCRRMVVLSEGEVLADGAPRELFAQRELLARAGLSVPQANLLLYELREAGLPVSLDILGVDECARAIFKSLCNR